MKYIRAGVKWLWFSRRMKKFHEFSLKLVDLASFYNISGDRYFLLVQIKVCVHNVCMVYIQYNSHTSMFIFKINVVHILNACIYNRYMHVNIFYIYT